MANVPGQFVSMSVTGVKELQANLREFQSERMLGKAVKLALQAGARVPLAAGKRNARGDGLGYIGFVKAPGRAEEKRYGRIPRALKQGRAYIPQGAAGTGIYRVNVVARNQRKRGIFPNRAPHAHLIEYGFNHKGGYRVVGRPFLGPALASTFVATMKAINDNCAKQVDAMRFPVDGKP